MFIKARALIGAAYARRIAWFSRIMGANDPVSQSRSNSVKPEQASIKAVQTKSNRIKPAVAENGGPAGGQKEPRECRPVKPSQTKSNRIEPNQTESNLPWPKMGLPVAKKSQGNVHAGQTHSNRDGSRFRRSQNKLTRFAGCSPSRNTQTQSNRIKPNQTKSNLPWVKMSLPGRQKSARGMQAGQTQSNQSNPVKPERGLSRA
jgi:hypothetical protein